MTNQKGFILIEGLISFVITIIALLLICQSIAVYGKTQQFNDNYEDVDFYSQYLIQNISDVYHQPSDYLDSIPKHYSVGVVAIPLEVLYTHNAEIIHLQSEHLEHPRVKVIFHNTIDCIGLLKDWINEDIIEFKVLQLMEGEQPLLDELYLVILLMGEQYTKDIYDKRLGVMRIDEVH